MKGNGFLTLWRLERSADKDKLNLASLVRFYKTFGRHYRKYWKTLAIAYGSLIVTILLSLLTPWPLKLIIDHVVLQEPLPQQVAFLAPWFATASTQTVLVVLALSVIAIELLISIFSYLDKFYLSSVGYRIVADIREQVFAHLQRLSLTFHDTAESGDIIYRMTSDIKEMKELMISAPQDLVYRLLTIVSIMTVMLLLNWQLGLIAFAVVPVMYLFAHRFGTAVEQAIKKLRKKESKIASIIAENVEAMALIQAYGQEETEKSRFDEQNQASLQFEVRSVLLIETFSWVMDMLMALGISAVLYFGAREVLGITLQPGTLVLFVVYLNDLYGPIDKLSEATMNLAKTQVSGERLMEIIDNDMVIEDSPDAALAPKFRGEIVFEDVHFAYSQGSEVLNGLSFVVKPGETVALVGHSGAGKSTLISLLLRFYDPQKGRILIDGTDIRQYGLQSLRENMTIVLQDAFLFRKSIRENIAFGKPGATEAEIEQAAHRAQAHDFITALPDGYNSLILEGGSNLSGGQQQRLSIARAIIRDTPIVILDEPTTGLDADSEALVNTAVRRLTTHKTTFIIAHQFATVRHAHKVLLLEQGKGVQFGTHAELMVSSPTYRELYELQMGNGRLEPLPTTNRQLALAN